MRQIDPLVDGRPWHWVVAVAVVVPLVIALLPLVALAVLFEKARDALR